jgi:hypothetical protein
MPTDTQTPLRQPATATDQRADRLGNALHRLRWPILVAGAAFLILGAVWGTTVFGRLVWAALTPLAANRPARPTAQNRHLAAKPRTWQLSIPATAPPLTIAPSPTRFKARCRRCHLSRSQARRSGTPGHPHSSPRIGTHPWCCCSWLEPTNRPVRRRTNASPTASKHQVWKHIAAAKSLSSRTSRSRSPRIWPGPNGSACRWFSFCLSSSSEAWRQRHCRSLSVA